MVLRLTTSAFEQGGTIPAKYTCKGTNVSPDLQWDEPPAGTQSFALIMDDPDAANGLWIHWVLFNLPPSARSLPEGLPAGEKTAEGAVQGFNSSRHHGYDGPCPPSGTHRYFFKLYALDTRLDLSPSANASDLIKAASGHILANTELMGLFSK